MTEAPIILTETAKQFVRDVITDAQDEDLYLRIYVAGGGCSGLQYGMALDQIVDADDETFQIDDIKVVLGAMDIKYILGSTVDYVQTNLGGGFKVENPNAVKACGCGSSFSVEDDAAGKTLTGGCGSCSKF
jgi:iron-sulfur cluster assembly accessory protein